MDLVKIKKILNENSETVFKHLEMECETFGDNVYCTCPVHEDSDNPRAFSYSIDKGIWKCWTRDCQATYNNDIFGLIRGVLSRQSGEELEFKDALRWACNLFNIKSTYNPIKTIEQTEDDLSKIISIMNHKEQEHKHEKIELDEIQVPSNYFVGRGFRKSTLSYFGVGDYYNKGVLKDRAVIPIYDDCGKNVIGAIGRSVKEYRQPKFLIYPKGFDKRYCFYNYHKAVKRANETSCMYILEGQGDVWRMHEAGVRNAVGLFGKNISTQQEAKLRKLSITHLIILMDNDQAGREARIQIQRQLGRMYKLTFPRLSNKDVGDMEPKKIKQDILSNLQGTY